MKPRTGKTVAYNILWPLWFYEVYLGASDTLTGWPLAWLILLTILGSIRIELAGL